MRLGSLPNLSDFYISYSCWHVVSSSRITVGCKSWTFFRTNWQTLSPFNTPVPSALQPPKSLPPWNLTVWQLKGLSCTTGASGTYTQVRSDWSGESLYWAESPFWLVRVRCQRCCPGSPILTTGMKTLPPHQHSRRNGGTQREVTSSGHSFSEW